MAEELLINVNITGEKEVSKLDTNIEKLTRTTNKTTNAMTDLRKSIKQAKADMLSAEEGTKEYSAALAKAASLQFKMKDMNDKLRLGVKDFGETSKNVAASVAGLSGGFSATIGIMGLFAGESESTQKAILAVQSALAVTQGLSVFADSIENMRDLWIGMKANIPITEVDNLGKSMEVAGESSKSMAGETAVLSSNLAGSKTAIDGLTESTKLSTKAVDGAMSAVNAYTKAQIDADIALLKGTGDVKEFSHATNQVIASMGELEPSIEDVQVALEKKSASLETNVVQTEKLTKATEKAQKSTGSFIKGIGSSLLTMGAFMLVIAAVTLALSFLIKKFNEVPEDIKIKISLQEEAVKQLASVQLKVSKWQSDYDKARKAGDTTHLKVLDDIAKKEFGLSDERIKLIKSTKDGWAKFFEEYLEMAYNTYYNEALLKKKVELEMAATIAEGNIGLYTQERNRAGNLFSALGPASRLKGAREELEKIQKQLEIIAKIPVKPLSDYFYKPTGGSGKPAAPASGLPKNFKTSALGSEKIGVIGDYESKSSKEAKEATAKVKADLDERGKAIIAYFDVSMSAAQAAADEEQRLHNEKMDRLEAEAQAYQDTLQAFSSVTYGIADLYQAQQDEADATYDSYEANINNQNISDAERTKLLEANEKARYEAKKEAFEQQKKWEEASAWVSFASGVVSIWSKSYGELGPIAGPIVAAAETAGLLATTLAQIKTIKSQTLEAPSSGSGSSSSSGGNSVAVALNPTRTAMTSRDEIINASGSSASQTVVKVTDINKVQNTVKVRESNSSY